MVKMLLHLFTKNEGEWKQIKLPFENDYTFLQKRVIRTSKKIAQTSLQRVKDYLQDEAACW